jgi:hypothetical protein
MNEGPSIHPSIHPRSHKKKRAKKEEEDCNGWLTDELAERMMKGHLRRMTTGLTQVHRSSVINVLWWSVQPSVAKINIQ